MGGLPLCSYLSVSKKIPMIMIRDSVKDYGTNKQIEGTYHKKNKCIIIEDVITTGGSVNEVIRTLNETECKIIGLAVLVDRSNGKIKLHPNQYSLASIDSLSYQELDLPKELARIPIQKPGSRFS